MLLKNALSQFNNLQFMIENLNLKSAMGKRFLLESPMLFTLKEIEAELNLVEKAFINLEEKKDFFEKLQFKLSQLRDIKGSIKNIGNNLVLDDVELFEIKHFAMVVREIFNLQNEHQFQLSTISSLDEVVKILDPDETNIPSFYIYDSFSAELTSIRKKIKLHKNTDVASDVEKNKDLDSLFLASEELEASIRAALCSKLFKFHKNLENTLTNLAHLDVIIAKAIQAKKMNLCKPSVSTSSTSYSLLFNPQLKEVLQLQQKKFQPIDIQIYKSVCFITGANMAGKTVVLKTVALCQYLFQFGFFVPAEKAEIAIVDKIMISIEESQSEYKGLSSFASEMIKVNAMVEEVIKGNNVLILIDELARTTNPVEGRAIVNAVATIFYENNVRSLITTHYSKLSGQCRKLRVKGLDTNLATADINQNNINNFIDYSLIEDEVGDTPHEALRVCTILGINPEIINKAQNELKN